MLVNACGCHASKSGVTYPQDSIGTNSLPVLKNSGCEANQNRIIRLTCDYKLVGVMLHEKLVKRDRNQFSSPSETVRIHILWK